MKPLLSILIPTHNRQRYAIHAIGSILEIKNDNFELIVTDTSTTDQLQKDLQNLGLASDIRLKYIRPTEKLDMTGNHNMAASLATGEYICLIGDDDTVLDNSLIAAQWALDHNIEIIAPSIVSNYAWPDFESIHFGFKHASRLYIPRHVSGIEIFDSKTAFKNALKNACQGTDNMPKIYHGLVKYSTLNRIKDITGNYFWGSSPDVSGAVGLALCSSSFATINYPLTIPGASGGSNTGRSALNQHKGKLGAEEQTKTFTDAGWSLGVPKFFSVETVWAHAAIETMQKINPSLLPNFNFAKLIAICMILHPEFSKDIDNAISEILETYNIAKTTLMAEVKKEMWKYRLKRFSYLLKRALRPTSSGGRKFISNLQTIAETPAALKNYMIKKGWDVRKYLHT